MLRYVVCAAIKNTDGSIICGARHYDLIMRKAINRDPLPESWFHCEQGFIDNFGQFLDRKEAYVLAKEMNQIRRRCGGDDGTLFSENLY